MFKKTILFALVLAIGLAALPFVGTSAAPINPDETTPPAGQPAGNERIENAWERLQTVYARQGERLGKTSALIEKIQTRIEQANTRGWDTSAVQAALQAFIAVIPNASASHESGAAIIASHSGFDANGKVSDRAAALVTVKSLGQVIKDTRSAMNGTGEALRAAIQAFREAHNLSEAPAP
jgi:hypothetical protein